MYRVTKAIKGRKYDYWQRTYRVGKSVRTVNIYIGPASSVKSLANGSTSAPAKPNLSQYERTVAEHQTALHNFQPRPKEPEIYKYDPDEKPKRADYSREEWLEYLREQRQRKREYEAAMKIELAAIRKAKRETRDVKAANPFLAKAITRASSVPTKAPTPAMAYHQALGTHAPQASIRRPIAEPKQTAPSYPKKSDTFAVKDQSTCNHSPTYHHGANPNRGFHDQHCTRCGMDMSYDSSGY